MIPYFILFGLLIFTLPLNRINKYVYLFTNVTFTWILMAFRSFTVGNDTLTYVQMYPLLASQKLSSNFLNWLFPLHEQRMETGYILYDKILFKIDPDPQFLLIISSLIMMVCLTIFIVKLDLDYYISLLTFDGFGFLAFYLSGLRQAMSISICMIAFIFAIKRKLIPFVITVWIAALFHVTAWVFVIVYLFSSYKKENKWKFNIFIAIFFILFIRFESVAAGFSSISNEFSNYNLNTINSANNGIISNILSIILVLSILIIYKKDSQSGNSIEYISKYSLLFSIFCYVIAFKFTQLSRLALFFNIGYFPILSFISLRLGKKADFLLSLAIISYFIVIQIIRPEWNNIVPYMWMN